MSTVGRRPDTLPETDASPAKHRSRVVPTCCALTGGALLSAVCLLACAMLLLLGGGSPLPSNVGQLPFGVPTIVDIRTQPTFVAPPGLVLTFPLAPPAPKKSPTAVPTPQVVSQTTYTGANLAPFMEKEIKSDSELVALLNWAVAQGKTKADAKAGDGVRAVLSNGVTVIAASFMSGPGDGIVALRLVAENGVSRPMLMTVEGTRDDPIVVLFAQNWRMSVSKDGVVSGVNGSRRTSGLARPLTQGGCTDGGWEDFKKCCSETGASWHYLGSTCVGLTYALYAVWATPAAAVAGVGWLATCGWFLGVCIPYSIVDNAPIPSARQVVPVPSGSYQTCGNNGTTLISQTAYQVWIDVDDDRKPFPPPISEILPGNITKVYTIRDCGGNTVNETIVTPLPLSYNSELCAAGTSCQVLGAGQAKCLPSLQASSSSQSSSSSTSQSSSSSSLKSSSSSSSRSGSASSSQSTASSSRSSSSSSSQSSSLSRETTYIGRFESTAPYSCPGSYFDRWERLEDTMRITQHGDGSIEGKSTFGFRCYYKYNDMKEYHRDMTFTGKTTAGTMQGTVVIVTNGVREEKTWQVSRTTENRLLLTIGYDRTTYRSWGSGYITPQ